MSTDAAGRGRPGTRDRLPAVAQAPLAMFACAIRGGPVELLEADAPPAGHDAPPHWTEEALRIAATDTDAPVELRLEALPTDEHGTALARIVRALAWGRAGSTALDIDAFLARWPDPARMRRLLAACEAIRVRPRIARLYPGAQAGLRRLDVGERASLSMPVRDAAGVGPGTDNGIDAGEAIASSLARIRLGLPTTPADDALPAELRAALAALAQPAASALDSARCAIACWRLARGDPPALATLAISGLLPIPESPTSALPPSAAGGEADIEAGDDGEATDPPPGGDAGAPGAGGDEAASGAVRPGVGAPARQASEGIRVDEWDYLGRRFLRRWCRIVVARPEPREGDYRAELLQRERGQARRLRRQFARLRDAATRRRRVFGDGEEIDADDMVRALVERRAGAAADEPRMIRREHTRRDVAVALLLDVSASTGFVLRDPDETPARPPPAVVEDDDPFLWSPTLFERSPPEDDEPPPRRVIDVARDAMGLLAQAFESLGDRFAIYAFSGSGREQVDFLVAKEFDETMGQPAWQALAGLEPMRSTRMGAAIRHAADRLGRRPERMRVLLVVSDGYPDDIDYGPDRRSIEYGLRDTARAIEQARGRGIDTLLVTVDRAGHDYLRRICPPGRYRVIGEIDSLAGEIARAYRTMTA